MQLMTSHVIVSLERFAAIFANDPLFIRVHQAMPVQRVLLREYPTTPVARKVEGPLRVFFFFLVLLGAHVSRTSWTFSLAGALAMMQ